MASPNHQSAPRDTAGFRAASARRVGRVLADLGQQISDGPAVEGGDGYSHFINRVRKSTTSLITPCFLPPPWAATSSSPRWDPVSHNRESKLTSELEHSCTLSNISNDSDSSRLLAKCLLLR